MIKTLLFFQLIGLSLPAFAADHQISLDHIQPYRATYEYFSKDETGSLQKIGTWIDFVQIEDGRVIRTVTRYNREGKRDFVRTVATTRSTLAPLYVTQQFGQDLTGFYHSRVEDGELTQILVANHQTPARIETARIPKNIVEVNLQGLFAVALMMRGQGTTTVDTYVGGAKPSGQTMTFEHQGQETKSFKGAEIPVEKIHQNETGWTYWARNTPPYLIQVEHPSPTGETLVSQLIEYAPQ